MARVLLGIFWWWFTCSRVEFVKFFLRFSPSLSLSSSSSAVQSPAHECRRERVEFSRRPAIRESWGPGKNARILMEKMWKFACPLDFIVGFRGDRQRCGEDVNGGRYSWRRGIAAKTLITTVEPNVSIAILPRTSHWLWWAVVNFDAVFTGLG